MMISGKQGRALAVLVLSAVALCSCGGGGGGGSSGSAPAADFHIEFSNNPLNFEYLEGDSTSSRIVTAIARGTLPGDLYVGIDVAGS
jgi:hypothetical protein